jgi:hypothetical protein
MLPIMAPSGVATAEPLLSSTFSTSGSSSNGASTSLHAPAAAAAAAAAAGLQYNSSAEELMMQGLALSKTYDPLLVQLALQPQRTMSTPHALQPLSAILPAAAAAAAAAPGSPTSVSTAAALAAAAVAGVTPPAWFKGLPAVPESGDPAVPVTNVVSNAADGVTFQPPVDPAAAAAAELAVAAAAAELAAQDAAAAAAEGLAPADAAAAVATAEAAAGLAAAVGAESLALLGGAAVPLASASEEVLRR